ncbi:hypothetical protein BD626DRAFT_506142, partial [Schizophyllum amplum]
SRQYLVLSSCTPATSLQVPAGSSARPRPLKSMKMRAQSPGPKARSYAACWTKRRATYSCLSNEGSHLYLEKEVS